MSSISGQVWYLLTFSLPMYKPEAFMPINYIFFSFFSNKTGKKTFIIKIKYKTLKLIVSYFIVDRPLINNCIKKSETFFVINLLLKYCNGTMILF